MIQTRSMIQRVPLSIAAGLYFGSVSLAVLGSDAGWARATPGRLAPRDNGVRTPGP